MPQREAEAAATGADTVLLAYVTCGTEDEALTLARILVQRRLAACANVRAHTAIYWWDGETKTEAEWAILAKTTRGRFEELRAAVVAASRYSLPCAVAVPVTEGHPPFLEWVRRETGT